MLLRITVFDYQRVLQVITISVSLTNLLPRLSSGCRGEPGKEAKPQQMEHLLIPALELPHSCEQ